VTAAAIIMAHPGYRWFETSRAHRRNPIPGYFGKLLIARPLTVTGRRRAWRGLG
jgi:hypothetical protein